MFRHLGLWNAHHYNYMVDSFLEQDLQFLDRYGVKTENSDPGDFRSWESPQEADNVWQLFM